MIYIKVKIKLKINCNKKCIPLSPVKIEWGQQKFYLNYNPIELLWKDYFK